MAITPRVERREVGIPKALPSLPAKFGQTTINVEKALAPTIKAVVAIQQREEAVAADTKLVALEAAGDEKRRELELAGEPGIDTAYAEWFRDRSQELIEGAPSRAVRQQMQLRLSRIGASQTARAQLSENRRAVGVTTGNLQTQLEIQQNTLLSEPGRFEALKTEFVDSVSNASGVIGEEATREFVRDGVQALTRSHVLGLIKTTDDPRAVLKRLNAGEFDPTLTPAAKEALIRESEREVAKIERERVAALRGQTKDAITVLDAGKTPPNLANLRAGVKGTELEEPLQDAINDREEMDAFGQLSPGEQQAQIAEFNQQETATADEVRLFQKKARRHAADVKMLSDGNGLSLAEDRGIIEPVEPIDITNPESLRKRARQADVASRHFGVTVSPFKPQEIESIETALANAPADQATGIALGLVNAFGPDQAAAIAGGLNDGKSPELAPVMLRAQDNPLIARDIVRGAQLKTQTPDLEITATQRREAIDVVVGDLFEGSDAGPLRGYIAAADALYASRRVPTGDLTFDADIYEQALRDVMGNPVEFNDHMIIPPSPDMDEVDVSDTVGRMTQPDLIEFGTGAPVFADGSPFTTDLFDDGAQLITSGPGRYMVRIPGLGFVQKDGGGVYELDLSAFMAGAGPVPRERPSSPLEVGAP